MYYEYYFLIIIYCLVLTLVIEFLLSLILGLRKKDLVNVILVNVLTNPLFNSLHPLFLFKWGRTSQMIAIGILEILIVISEGAIYSMVLKSEKIKPYLLSLILNAASFVFGMLINYFIFG